MAAIAADSAAPNSNSSNTLEVRPAPTQHPFTTVPDAHAPGTQLTPRFFPPTELVPLADTQGRPTAASVHHVSLVTHQPVAGAGAAYAASDDTKSAPSGGGGGGGGLLDPAKPTQPTASRTAATPRDVHLDVQRMEMAARGHVYQPHELFPGKVAAVPPGQGGCCGTTPLPPKPMPMFAAGVEEQFEHYTITSVVIIYNPFSGNGKALGEFKQLEASLRAHGITIVELPTKGPKHATQLAQETAMEGRHDAFIVIGGDGTFHEFVNGYMRRTQPGPKPPVGFIAGGTGNSVMTSLGLTDTAAATRMITRGLVTRFDLGSVNTVPDDGKGVYWLNLIGWGVAADANVTAEACRCCGPLRYNFGGLVSVCQNKTRNAVLDVDGCKIAGPFDTVFIQNNPHAGSALRIAPYAHVNDGMMDAVIANHRCCCTVLGMFEELKKDGRHVYGEAIDYRRFKKLTITADDEQLINVDGENGWRGKAWVIETHARALPLLYHKVDADAAGGGATPDQAQPQKPPAAAAAAGAAPALTPSLSGTSVVVAPAPAAAAAPAAAN